MISEPIPAGTHDIELRMPTDPTWAAIAGLVVDRRGQAVAGASIWCGREFVLAPGLAKRRDLAVPVGTVDTTRIATDARGGFAPGSRSRRAGKILIQAPGIAHATPFDLASLRDGANLRLVVPVKVPTRIVSTPGSRAADSASFVDRSGTRIAVTITHGDRAWDASNVLLVDGQSEVMTVPDSAVELVLFSKGKELSRMPVDLVPGKLQLIEPRL